MIVGSASVSDCLVQFSLDSQRYALPLRAVERVVRVVAITPLPKAPAIVLGIIDVEGAVIPVINLRERFNHPWRSMRLSDHLIVSMAGVRRVALLVDEASGVIEAPAENRVPAEAILPSADYVDGAVKCENGLVLIHDLERLLSLEEQRGIDAALGAEGRDEAALDDVPQEYGDG